MNIEIEYDLTGAVKDYAMYTELGNAGVHAIVVAARANQLTWTQVVNALRQLSDSNEDVFGEAMDTAVRECVYDALGFRAKGQNFYGA
jgi:hypothetical protein